MKSKSNQIIRFMLSTLSGLLLVSVGLISVFTIPAFAQTEHKITASDGTDGDSFGFPVALDGGTALIGARRHDNVVTGPGAAYIYEQDENGIWQEVQQLIALDGTAGDLFGFDLAIEGDVAVVGAFYQNNRSGAVYIFYRDYGGAGNWGQVAKLTSPSPWAGEEFGVAVAIQGDTLIVGACAESGTLGAVYIYNQDSNDPNTWNLTKTLDESNVTSLAAGDYFGIDVALDGDTLLVGAHYDDEYGSGSGSVYVFYRNQGGVDNWGEVIKLTAADGYTHSFFGEEVAISGDIALIGAHGDDEKGSASGAAYLFYRHQGGADHWGQLIKLTAPDGVAGDWFGSAVALQGDLALIGAPGDDNRTGSAYIFNRLEGGYDQWGMTYQLIASDGVEENWFGSSVAVSAENFIIGAPKNVDPLNTTPGIGSGSAYLYSDYAAPIHPPAIEASTSHNWVQVFRFDESSTLSLSIYETCGGDVLYQTDAWNYNPINGWWMDVGIFGVDLIAGNCIIVSDGVHTKSLVVVELSMTDFNHQTDTVSGISDPFAWVDVYASEHHLLVQADENGNWLAVFSQDLDVNTRTNARVFDEDWDATIAEAGWIEASPTYNRLSATNFSPHATVTFELLDADGATPLMDAQTVPTDHNGQAHIQVDHLVDVLPGQIVRVTDGVTGYAKTLQVVHHTLDLVDTVNDFAEGTAPPNAPMILHLVDQGVHYVLHLQADPSGHWEYDFTQPGIDLDLSAYARVTIWVIEPDDDVTSDELPTITASLRDHWVYGDSFTPNIPVRLDCYTSPLDSLPFASHDIQANSDGRFWFELKAYGEQLTVGNYLVASWEEGGKTYTKELLLEFVDTDFPNYDLDLAHGKAPGNAMVRVEVQSQGAGHAELWTQATSGGDWSADFSGIIDITLSHWIDASVEDADRDRTLDTSPEIPTFIAYPNENRIEGEHWLLESNVTVYVNGSEYATQLVTEPNGRVEFRLGEDYGLDLLPGDLVTLSDGNIVKELTIADLVIIQVNAEANTISGTTDSPLDVQLWVHPGVEGSFIHITPSEGYWIADFNPFNILPGDGGAAVQYDEDSDGTWVEWRAPQPRFTIQPDHRWAQGEDWPIGVPITVTIDDDSDPTNGFIYQAINTSEPSEWDPSMGTVWFELRDVGALARGLYVSMTDGVTFKDTWIADLYLDKVDPVADTASGRGPAGASGGVHIESAGDSRFVEIQVQEDGTWLADFSVVGFDITSVDDANVVVWDDDGDETMAHLPPPPWIEVLVTENQIHGLGWIMGSEVTLQIDDLGTPAAPDYTAVLTVNSMAPWDPSLTLVLFDNLPFTIQPGFLVSMSDGTTIKEHRVSPLAIDGVDYQANTMWGLANPEVEVILFAFGPVFEQIGSNSDSSGNWEAHFSIDCTSEHTLLALEADEDNDATLVFWKQAPHIVNISAPLDPVQVGTHVTVSASFHDPDSQSWSAVWDWGDGSTAEGEVGEGIVSGEHTYTVPGVYTLQLTITDDKDAADTGKFEYIVVYDPSGGFVTGGGWIWSPLGAFMEHPMIEGKASFGFHAKYKPGATVPSGQTEFFLHNTQLKFKSTSYDWLVVYADKAIIKGSGTINGLGSYKFILMAVDGDIPGRDGIDRFYIKIWYEDETGEKVIVYDSMIGAWPTYDTMTPVGGGSITVHKPK